MRESFTFIYEPNSAGVAAGVSLSAWGNPVRKARTLSVLFVFPFALAFAGLFIFLPELGIAGALLLAAFGVFLWGICFAFAFREWLVHWLLKRQLLRSPRQQITVDPEGVEHKSGGSTNHLAWSVVSHIRELDRLFLLLSAEKAVGAIEKSAVPTAAELAELREFLRALKPFESLSGARARVA